MNLLLIGSIPSSGSTFLVYLLSKHNMFLCLPETGLFTQGRVFLKNQKETSNNLNSSVPWINVQLKLYQSLGWEMPFEDDQGFLIDPLHIVEQQIPSSDNQIIVEKTPENIFAFEYYLSANKDHKVIVTSRDLEGTCTSLIKRGFNVIEAIIIWFSHGIEILRLLKRYPKQVFHLRYDEFSANPDDYILKIMKFIGKKDNFLSNTENQQDHLTTIGKQYQWILNKSSWFLSDRYWSKKIDASTQHTPLKWELGIEFQSLIEAICFETFDFGLLQPKSLDMALQTDSHKLASVPLEKHAPLKLEARSDIIHHLINSYSIGFIR